MAGTFEISFKDKQKPLEGTVVCLAAADGAIAGAERADPSGIVARAAKAAKFKGKALSTLDILVPEGSTADRLIVLGLGDPAALKPHDWLKAGGTVAAKVRTASAVTIFLDAPGVTVSAREAADFALGMQMNAYRFDAYKTAKKTEEDAPPKAVKVTLISAAGAEAKKAMGVSEAVTEGVFLARDLVNLPPNDLGPVEFAAKAKALEELGVEVEILTEKEMTSLGMGALLGVAQGSSRPPRLVVMRWNGLKGKDKQGPIAFIGKGVVFDSGGISIKPGAGMEEMKGDMGGAAAVTGLMHVLARRKAKADVIGIIGLVENMPDGNAQRPGDIVTSMSGQTIEIINTDAEGRLVLCDALWYCNEKFKPRFMINLATLTGAIMVALGSHHAGLFCNDDALAAQLIEAGLATNERVWRMPLGPDYDKMIDSKFADMKNTGGRYAGAVTAAQFLKRFVKETPWAHLDVAGTAMNAPTDEINQSWGSGFGVRLLDELVRAHYEA
ncbi:leucyl aminopeptidase [Rhizobium sp. CC-YZS058]|uniref:leucyl aminopeptidase n=1 Tax=Rhizobium sp. CC-YZS058 TaxID=3042153 RepID=UPI002B05D896|nr:leucyl aminopeptidase [Rhizobium sp. CC-YZS058]MEA3535362.1 leucyl aminopeptidase [Rhizobium sp. CC-YZS058]